MTNAQDPNTPQQPTEPPTQEAAATPTVPAQDASFPEPVPAPPSADSSWVINQEKNKVAPWALGLGIVAAVLAIAVVTSVLALPVAIAGVIVGIIAVVKARGIAGEGRRMGMSITGLVLSILVTLITGFLMIMSIIFFAQHGDDLMACVDRYGSDNDQVASCISDAIAK
ncbi:hypothetical protein ACUY3K_07700 [Corynebacterium uberis]|uniref:DUF4190 domain-containing protein n=1 Tax=Corynebacterium TaxID=1716 RepID=UPI001D0B6D3C|nr:MULTISPECIES: DUF4190 domain-containing protein [Corynebacterium]MCZ9308515.1 hypothetical protein [Corynebacterium sp. c6VSa_13]UDL74170.1 hypothetical protein LH391_02820 [Corynebacterium uberis]UDL74946.1 hypothetical protein LH393_06585 [Corynebacterium uberis]UDL77161.1 hypothetical protein LH394_06575 [Corynebacterium uberis]UDL79443.1 hypothetical protein LH392_06990 [Corynebacterium uberis]